MVAIRHKPLAHARRPNVGGGGGINRQGNHWSSCLTVRNAILCVVAVQGVQLLFRIGGGNSSSSSNNNNNAKPSSSSDAVHVPLTLEEALQGSRGSLNRKQRVPKNMLRIRDRNEPLAGSSSHKGGPPLTPLEQSEQARRFHERQEHHEAPKTKTNNNKQQQQHDVEAIQNSLKDHELAEEHQAQEKHDNITENDKDSKESQQEEDPYNNPKSTASKKFFHDSTHQVLTKHGTGPTQVGYVVDLAHERQNPAFRTANNSSSNNNNPKLNDAYFSELESRIQQQLSSKVHACEKAAAVVAADKGVNENAPPGLDPKCNDEDTRLVAYNGAWFTRHVCGQELAPGKAMLLKEDCHVTWDGKAEKGPPNYHLLPQDAVPLDGKGMPPILVTLEADTVPEKDKMESIDDCDIPCLWEPSDKFQDRHIAGTNWKIRWSEKDPASDRHAHMERTDHRHDIYYATTSWQSSIPLSTFSFDKYDFRKAPAIDFDSTNNAATSVLNSHCNGTPIRRQKWMASAKAKLKQVHFYGSCEHTTNVPAGASLDNLQGRLNLMKQDRIVLAYEAGTEKWHTTDIVWEALMSGAVPAILGASNLEADILPPHAALYGSIYNSWDQFSEFIQKVADDKELWSSYQTWRTDEAALTAFEERLNFTRTDPKCRTCRWAYAKMYGLGWNHAQQLILANHMDRRFCLNDKTKLVAQPFVESWWLETDPSLSSTNEEETGGVACQEQSSQTTIESLGLERWVWNHDGFTDILLQQSQNKDQSIVLRLQVRVHNTEGALFRHVHTLVPDALRSVHVSSAAIQDQHSKVTVLCDFVAEFRSSTEGILEVHIPPVAASATGKQRIRIVTEDFDGLHGKLTEYFPSSYAKMAMKDFVDPVDLFYVA